MFTRSELTLTQVVALLSPVSVVYARNAWDHDPPFGEQLKWLTFLDTGFPTEARLIPQVHDDDDDDDNLLTLLAVKKTK